MKLRGDAQDDDPIVRPLPQHLRPSVRKQNCPHDRTQQAQTDHGDTITVCLLCFQDVHLA